MASIPGPTIFCTNDPEPQTKKKRTRKDRLASLTKGMSELQKAVTDMQAEIDLCSHEVKRMLKEETS